MKISASSLYKKYCTLITTWLLLYTTFYLRLVAEILLKEE